MFDCPSIIIISCIITEIWISCRVEIGGKLLSKTHLNFALMKSHRKTKIFSKYVPTRALHKIYEDPPNSYHSFEICNLTRGCPVRPASMEPYRTDAVKKFRIVLFQWLLFLLFCTPSVWSFVCQHGR